MKSSKLNNLKNIDTAILFLIFNRPNYTKKVFERIRDVKPKKLYVASDGPREENPDDKELVEISRKIATKIDWDCDVKTLFRDRNLGLKKSVADSITWFFKNEKEGIILEDDCLPDITFFKYCEEMLYKFEKNKTIWMICGFNPRHQLKKTNKVFLSQNPSVWGWATWRDRWSKYNINMPTFNLNDKLELHADVPKYVYKYYKKNFNDVYKGKIISWAFQFVFEILINKGLVVKPYTNLIRNIGVYGTHGADKSHKNFNTKQGTFLPQDFYDCKFDITEDLWFYETRIKKNISSYLWRLKVKIKKIFF